MDSNFKDNFKIANAVTQYSQYWNKFKDTILDQFDPDDNSIELSIRFEQDDYSGVIKMNNSGIFVDDNDKKRLFYIKFANTNSIGLSYNYMFDNSFDYIYGKPLILFINKDNSDTYLYKERVFDRDYMNIIDDFEERMFQYSTTNANAIDYNLLQMQMHFYDEMHDAMHYNGVMEIGTNKIFVEQDAVLEKLKRLYS